MSFATRLSYLEVTWQSSDPRTMEERRTAAWKRFFEFYDQGLRIDHDLFVEMRACDANLAQLVKERYERVGFEPLPTDEREMGPF